MARTELAMNKIVQTGIVDPTGVTGLVGGHQFFNNGATSHVRIVNAASTANAVATLSLGAATPSGGTYKLVANIFGKHYTTAAIAFGALKATIATAVLAATEDVTGNALSADFPVATCVGAGTDLPTGPVTLTFGGTGVTGLAQTPITMSLDSTSTTGGTYALKMTTLGTGTGRVTFEAPVVTTGIQNANVVYALPVGTSHFGPFPTSYFNQPTTGSAPNDVFVDFDAQFASYTITGFAL